MVKTKKTKKVKKVKKLRPPRIFRTKTGRKYFIQVVKGKKKRTYIKSKLPDSQIIKIIINNILTKPSKTRKRKKGKKGKKRPTRKSGKSGVSFGTSEPGVIIPKQEVRQEKIDYVKLLQLFRLAGGPERPERPTQGVILPKKRQKIGPPLRKLPPGLKLQIMDKKNVKKDVDIKTIDNFPENKIFHIVDDKGVTIKKVKRSSVNQFLQEHKEAQELIKEQKREIKEQKNIITNRKDQDLVDSLPKRKLQIIALGGDIESAFKTESKLLFSMILENKVITKKEWDNMRGGSSENAVAIFNDIFLKYEDIVERRKQAKEDAKEEAKLGRERTRREKEEERQRNKDKRKEQRRLERERKEEERKRVRESIKKGKKEKKESEESEEEEKVDPFDVVESDDEEIVNAHERQLAERKKDLEKTKKRMSMLKKGKRRGKVKNLLAGLLDKNLSKIKALKAKEEAIKAEEEAKKAEEEEAKKAEEAKEAKEAEEITDPEEIEALGSGKIGGKGLSSSQLYNMMKNYKHFTGIYALDTFKQSPVKAKMGFILNLDPIKKAGSHWVAVWIDSTNDKSLEYYDSLANNPPKSFLRDIKKIITKINPSTYLKFKINKIKRQSDTTDTCGYHAVKFLSDRFNKKPWVECSGYNDVKNGENAIKKFKKKFEYI